MISLRFLAALSICAALLSGCGTAACDKPRAYQNSPDLPPLRVPPDLDAPARDSGLAVPEVSEAARQKTKPCRDRPPTIGRADRPAQPAAAVVADEELAERARTRTEERTRAELRETLERWSDAWNAGDLDAFLALYAQDFETPEGIDLAAWRDANKRRLAEGERIDLLENSLQIDLDSTDGASAQFLQSIVTGEQSTQVRKRLGMVRTVLGWRIRTERVLDIL